jgi:hypothetical protein
MNPHDYIREFVLRGGSGKPVADRLNEIVDVEVHRWYCFVEGVLETLIEYVPLADLELHKYPPDRCLHWQVVRKADGALLVDFCGAEDGTIKLTYGEAMTAIVVKANVQRDIERILFGRRL